MRGWGRSCCFNTQPPEGGCRRPAPCRRPARSRFNTQPPEGGCVVFVPSLFRKSDVSTHSRPKAAASISAAMAAIWICFNTQPPEGGCHGPCPYPAKQPCFNTQPPEGGCRDHATDPRPGPVSTHSRPKAAAPFRPPARNVCSCFNTQPPESGCYRRPCFSICDGVFQHTAARRRLPQTVRRLSYQCMFQHTAARRRLHPIIKTNARMRKFQHTAARRRLPKKSARNKAKTGFQHTAARRRLPRTDSMPPS